MTKTEQDKILESRIKSNTANFTLNRQSAIVSAFADGDFDKYEYLTCIDLALKPNSLQKARFEHSPLCNLSNNKQKNVIDGSKYNKNGNSKDNENGDGTDSEYEILLDEVARLPFDRRQSNEDTFTATSLPRESFNDANILDNIEEINNLIVDESNRRIDTYDEVLENLRKVRDGVQIDNNMQTMPNQIDRQDSGEYDQSISDTSLSIIASIRHRPPRFN